ncbi:Pectinesterase inhibitor domain [Dillenia turbinata]|uniref:Pectinesterase inhibitor domain n=1 Tax=Dillenia turbinata TaxID=194707 RepID=A0AAN8ZRQ4_9MAGN
MEGKNPLITTLLILLTTYRSTCSARVVTNTEFIKSSCGVTTYPQLCYNSLSTYASKIQTSPKLLANTALFITLSNTKATSTEITKLSKQHGIGPREASAMADCVETLGDSVDMLQQSMAEMGQASGSDFGLHMNNIQTWVSAALTDEDTCMDGFAGNSMNGNVENMVRSKIVNITHLTSNALALINNYASGQTGFPQVKT